MSGVGETIVYPQDGAGQISDGVLTEIRARSPYTRR
jgi:RNA polymerase-interacting CarD/CdnL/TRCF family regulator